MTDVRKVAKLLGGQKVLGRSIKSAMDLHNIMEHGLPLQSLRFFAESRRHISADDVLTFVLGRRKAHSRLSLRLGPHQTGRLFVVADTLANARDTLTSMRKAEEWLTTPLASPEMGGRRPLELLSTPVGEKMVAEELAEALSGTGRQGSWTQQEGGF